MGQKVCTLVLLFFSFKLHANGLHDEIVGQDGEQPPGAMSCQGEQDYRAAEIRLHELLDQHTGNNERRGASPRVLKSGAPLITPTAKIDPKKKEVVLDVYALARESNDEAWNKIYFSEVFLKSTADSFIRSEEWDLKGFTIKQNYHLLSLGDKTMTSRAGDSLHKAEGQTTRKLPPEEVIGMLPTFYNVTGERGDARQNVLLHASVPLPYRRHTDFKLVKEAKLALQFLGPIPHEKKDAYAKQVKPELEEIARDLGYDEVLFNVSGSEGPASQIKKMVTLSDLMDLEHDKWPRGKLAEDGYEVKVCLKSKNHPSIFAADYKGAPIPLIVDIRWDPKRKGADKSAQEQAKLWRKMMNDKIKAEGWDHLVEVMPRLTPPAPIFADPA